jgi:hypothetical protein
VPPTTSSQGGTGKVVKILLLSNLTFFGSLIGALGAFAVFSGEFFKFRHSDRVKTLSKRLRVGGAIAALAGAALSTMGSKYAEWESKNQSEELGKLNRYIAAAVTGDDSYCTATFMFRGPWPGVIEWAIVHHGKYPVYDVDVRINDETKQLSLLESRPKNDRSLRQLEKIESAEKTYRIGTVPPVTVYSQTADRKELSALPRKFALMEITGTDRQIYRVEIVQRNGVVNQFIEGQKKNGQWTFKGNTSVMLTGHPPVSKKNQPLEEEW